MAPGPWDRYPFTAGRKATLVTTEGSARGASLKALIVGTLAILFSCAMASYAYFLFEMGDMAGDWFPFAASITFLLVLFGLNPLLRLVHRRLELDRVELLVVFVMVFVATPMATEGFAASFLSNILAPFFNANTSNDWWQKLIQHYPLWLYPRDARATTWFWEGSPPESPLPWGAWIGPWAWWGAIFAALYALMTTLVTFLRKQWMENERLIFPIMEAPLALLEDYEKGTRVPPAMRTRLFWLGVALPVAIFGSRILSAINSDFPSIRIFGFSAVQIVILPTWDELHLHVLPWLIAFAFFVKRDVLLSLWVFGFLTYVEKQIMKSLGYSVGPTIIYEDGVNNPALAWQSLGGMVVLVGLGLYMARRHLKSVARKALFNDPEVDDSSEIMSYRSAGVVFLLSIATLAAIFLKMGMTPGVALLMLATLILFYIGISRYVIEGGMAMCRPPVPVLGVVIACLGAKSMPIACLGAVAACAVFANDGRAGFAPMLANTLKLTEGQPWRPRSFLKVALYSLALGSVASLLLAMKFCYRDGLINMSGETLEDLTRNYLGSIVNSLDNTPNPDMKRMLWAGIGAVITGALALCRYTLAWWPLHPIGFALATGWGTQVALGSIFLAWAAKTIIIRFGGASLYTRSKPFFIGLLIGHILAQAALYVCNLIQGAPGIFLKII